MNETHKQLIEHAKQKVEAYFSDFTVPAHGFDHVMRVTVWAKRIAQEEQATHPALCELAGLLHDIGRVPEHFEGKKGGHHFLSYDLLRQWFREDTAFDVLSDDEKKELLYAVRYHWNDQANDYDTAWILRDADKLDAFGEIGLDRLKEHYGDGERRMLQELRFLFQMHHDFRTDTAKKIFEDEDLFAPLLNYNAEKMREAIEPIEL